MSEITKSVSTSETNSETYQQEVLEVETPMPATPGDKYINTKGANLNYAIGGNGNFEKVYCADKDSLCDSLDS
jgi:hypothetical protein